MDISFYYNFPFLIKNNWLLKCKTILYIYIYVKIQFLHVCIYIMLLRFIPLLYLCNEISWSRTTWLSQNKSLYAMILHSILYMLNVDCRDVKATKPSGRVSLIFKLLNDSRVFLWFSVIINGSPNTRKIEWGKGLTTFYYSKIV